MIVAKISSNKQKSIANLQSFCRAHMITSREGNIDFFEFKSTRANVSVDRFSSEYLSFNFEINYTLKHLNRAENTTQVCLTHLS